MSEEYEVSRVDWDFDVTARSRPKGRGYSPEYPRNTEQERPVCKHSDRCESCPYPAASCAGDRTGAVCEAWSLKSMIPPRLMVAVIRRGGNPFYQGKRPREFESIYQKRKSIFFVPHRHYDYRRCGELRIAEEKGQFNDLGYVSYHGTLSFEELMMEDPAEQSQGMQMGGHDAGKLQKL